jgi:hypothetical protein
LRTITESDLENKVNGLWTCVIQGLEINLWNHTILIRLTENVSGEITEHSVEFLGVFATYYVKDEGESRHKLPERHIAEISSISNSGNVFNQNNFTHESESHSFDLSSIRRMQRGMPDLSEVP